MALTTNFGGDLRKLHRYYEETTRTLTKMRNHQGVALCMRSIGEIACVHDDPDAMGKAWELSERLFVKLRLPEAEQLSVWRGSLG